MESNTYQVLFNQLPDYFKPVIEFLAILKAHGYGVDDLMDAAGRIAANNYILTADAETISDWEKILEIVPRPYDTLDFRRMQVLLRFNSRLPYSIGFLNDRLTELYGVNGYTLNIDYINQTLDITITASRDGAVDLLYNLLWEVLPTHMAITSRQNVAQDLPTATLFIGGFVSSTYIQTLPEANDGI